MTFEKEWRTLYPATVTKDDGKEKSGLIVRDPDIPEATGLVLRVQYKKDNGLNAAECVEVLWQQTDVKEWVYLIDPEFGNYALEVLL